MGNTSRVVLVGALALGALVAIGTLGSGVLGGSKSSTPDISDFASQFSPQTTAEQYVDPWVPQSGTGARQGYRYVAVEVVAENTSDVDQAAIFANPEEYTLSDDHNFVYAPIADGGAEPRLASVQLDKGKKAHGWITFEIPVDAKVSSLSDYSEQIDLPR